MQIEVLKIFRGFIFPSFQNVHVQTCERKLAELERPKYSNRFILNPECKDKFRQFFWINLNNINGE